MRFLLDANMPRSAVELLRTCGHEVEAARDIGLGAAPDDEIASRLPDNATALEITDVLERFITESAFVNALAGRLAILERDRVRFRPPLF